MSDERALRDLLEQSQQETVALRRTVDRLTAQLETLEAQLKESKAERERLGRLVLQKLNPDGQTSAFSVKDVAELVAFLKKG
jgi:hypothetical protein